MARIEFIEKHVVRGATRAEDVIYEKGQIVSFEGWIAETYAQAYIDRGHAVPAKPEPKPEVVKVVAEPAKDTKAAEPAAAKQATLSPGAPAAQKSSATK